MLQMLDFLRRAGELAGAAGDRPLLAGRGRVAHHRGVERTRAAARKFVRLRRFRALLRHHAQHLRNDVASTLDRHRVADAHAEAFDFVRVVQRRVGHHDAADGHRLQTRNGRERAGAADVDIDRPDHGRCLLGRKLVRNRPTRIARDEPEPLLPIEAVDFVDHAVDVVVERGALGLDFVVEREHRVDRVADLHQRVGLEAAGGKPFDHAGLSLRRHRAHFPPAIGEEAERPGSGDRRIELAQRARRRVARIGENLLAGRLLPLVEREEGGFGHVDLAPHLADVGHPFAAQLIRDVGERSHVWGHVLAFGTVAARRAAHQTAALVA